MADCSLAIKSPKAWKKGLHIPGVCDHNIIKGVVTLSEACEADLDDHVLTL